MIIARTDSKPAPKLKNLTSLWNQLLLWLSSIVFIEPAPVDLLTSGTFVARLLAGSKQILIPQSPAICLCLFALSNLLSSFAAEDFRKCLFVLAVRFYLMAGWFLFVDMVRQSSLGDFKKLWRAYALTAMLSSIIGILGTLGIIPIEQLSYDAIRPKAFFKDPNVFGPFMVPAALFSFSEIKQYSGKISWFYVSAFIATSFGVILSFSRGAWGNYVAAFGLYVGLQFLGHSSKKLSKRDLIISITFLLGMIGGLLIFLHGNPQFLEMLDSRAAVQAYDSDRFTYQRIALEKGLTNFIGAGPGQTEVSVVGHSTHSLYLRLLAETSWLGLMGFFGLTILSLAQAFRGALRFEGEVKSLYVIIFASLIGILLNSAVVDTLHWRHFWLMLAFAWFIPRGITRTSPSNNPDTSSSAPNHAELAH